MEAPLDQHSQVSYASPDAELRISASYLIASESPSPEPKYRDRAVDLGSTTHNGLSMFPNVQPHFSDRVIGRPADATAALLAPKYPLEAAVTMLEKESWRDEVDQANRDAADAKAAQCRVEREASDMQYRMQLIEEENRRLSYRLAQAVGEIATQAREREAERARMAEELQAASRALEQAFAGAVSETVEAQLETERARDLTATELQSQLADARRGLAATATQVEDLVHRLEVSEAGRRRAKRDLDIATEQLDAAMRNRARRRSSGVPSGTAQSELSSLDVHDRRAGRKSGAGITQSSHVDLHVHASPPRLPTVDEHDAQGTNDVSASSSPPLPESPAVVSPSYSTGGASRNTLVGFGVAVAGAHDHGGPTETRLARIDADPEHFKRGEDDSGKRNINADQSASRRRPQSAAPRSRRKEVGNLIHDDPLDRGVQAGLFATHSRNPSSGLGTIPRVYTTSEDADRGGDHLFIPLARVTGAAGRRPQSAIPARHRSAMHSLPPVHEQGHDQAWDEHRTDVRFEGASHSSSAAALGQGYKSRRRPLTAQLHRLMSRRAATAMDGIPQSGTGSFSGAPRVAMRDRDTLRTRLHRDSGRVADSKTTDHVTDLPVGLMGLETPSIMRALDSTGFSDSSIDAAGAGQQTSSDSTEAESKGEKGNSRQGRSQGGETNVQFRKRISSSVAQGKIRVGTRRRSKANVLSAKHGSVGSQSRSGPGPIIGEAAQHNGPRASDCRPVGHEGARIQLPSSLRRTVPRSKGAIPSIGSGGPEGGDAS